ncbi:MAG: shikimate dehydrogenase [Verrucomicrobiae bacterium]|nr:shikimate dehydrogenase [Verrucomicrobiae bacterium]
MPIDGKTRIVGVLGDPVVHSASPAMHNAAFTAVGLNWVYVACHVPPERLAGAIRGARDLGWVGLNLTVPHKVAALELVEELDDEAKQLGAVNTLRFGENGRIEGYNTDGYGLVKALEEEFGLTLAGRRVLILGAGGGAGRALAMKCALERVDALYLANRTRERVKELAARVRATGTKVEVLSLVEAASVLDKVELIINATSVGLHPGDTLPVRPGRVHYVYDTIYNPPETALLRVARQAGARVANGLSMLLHQGARAWEIWTGRPAPIGAMRAALQTAIAGTSG